MSKKSVVLLTGLGIAAATAGAWVVRRVMVADTFPTSTFPVGTFPVETFSSDAGDSDAVVATGSVPTDTLSTTEWNGTDEDGFGTELAAAVDDEPVNVR